MLRDALELIFERKEKPEAIITIDGRKYHTLGSGLSPVEDPEPEFVRVSTLSSLCDYLEMGESGFDENSFVHIVNPCLVTVRGQLKGSFLQRPTYLEAIASSFELRALPVEDFIIMLQSNFVETEDRESLLRLLSNLRAESTLSIADDGISQETTARAGIAKVENVKVPNPVTLKPFRTFPEIEQPESTFVFRMQQGAGSEIVCRLIESDGGRWKIEAIKRIKEWLEGNVVTKKILA